MAKRTMLSQIQNVIDMAECQLLTKTENELFCHQTEKS